MQNVPKVLGDVRQAWCPEALLITFKLETDPRILESKVRSSMAAYGQHITIGNLLQSRHDVVHVFSANACQKLTNTGSGLEERIAEYLVGVHDKFIN